MTTFSKSAVRLAAVALACGLYSVSSFAGNVAIVQGGWYTPNLKTKMEAAGHTVTEIPSYTSGSLDAFDAVIQDGNSYVDVNVLREYATAGGKVIVIPWTANNWSVPADMQVMDNASCADYSVAYPGVTVLDSGHPYLTGVTFPAAGGFNIGRVCNIQFIAEASEQIANWGDANSAFLGTRTVGAGQLIHLNMHLITSDTAYLVIEQDWAINLVSNLIDVDQANASDVARFHVYKTFTDLRTDEVDVTLTCNGGLPLQQDFTIAGGDPAGVTFTVTNIPAAGISCAVTESGGPDNYTPVMDCEWDGVTSGFRTCAISNEPDDGTFTVNMSWLIDEDNEELIDTTTPVTIWCDAAMVPGSLDSDSGNYYYMTSLADGDYQTVTVETTTGDASCWATQDSTLSGVELSGDCEAQAVSAGEDANCTFENTYFFEGIPTLSQYGMALLVLLTLGVGMVGLRRYT